MTYLTPTSQSRRRGDLPAMTGRMHTVLKRLVDAKRGDLFMPALMDVHGRTLRALVERDWIAESRGLDGMRYYITGRGIKAYAVYSRGGHRFDGMCRCGQRPRGYYSTGKRKPYCNVCLALYARRRFKLKGYQLKAETPCSRCKKRPRHVYPSGKRITYCTHCRQVLRRTERKQKMKRKLWLISIGRPPICLKCDSPVYHTPKTVYDYCYTHYRQQQNAWLRKQKESAA